MIKNALVLLGLLWIGICPALGAPSLLVADTQSGFVLESKGADALKYPASLTKVMTLYITFEALNTGALSMDDALPISKHAASQPKSKLYLKAGDTITVREAILALIVKSANDAAVVLAEALAPSEEAFALIMTSVAQDLGMTHTVFKNASGLHHPEQHTTARDLALLTMALIDHYPAYYQLFSTRSFMYNGRKYVNHNHLLQFYEGAEGLKTGFISAVGYNIITTAKRGNHRLVSIVIGDKNVPIRDRHVAQSLDRGFAKIAHKSNAIAPLSANLSRQRAIINRPQREYYQSIVQKSIVRTRQQVAQLAQHKTATLATLLPKEQPAVSVRSEQGDSEPNWGIQIGAFSTAQAAQDNATQMQQLLGDNAKTVSVPRVKKLYRSRLYGFGSKQEAKTACQTAKRNKIACMVIAPSVN